MREFKDIYEEWNNYEGEPKDLYPLLTKAVCQGNFLRLARLLDGEPEIECEAITDSQYALRPIHFAAERFGDDTSAALLTMLLGAGADPDAKSRDVRNPERPWDYTTPLHMVVSQRKHAAAIVLLNGGADPNIPSGCYLPLHSAAELDDALMVHVLVARGTNVNARSTNSNAVTPLHVAAQFGSASACKALWFEGADLNALDSKGKTPRGFAIDSGHGVVAELLGSLGAGDQARAIDAVTLTGAPIEGDDSRSMEKTKTSKTAKKAKKKTVKKPFAL